MSSFTSFAICAMAGTNCEASTIAELQAAKRPPFIYHCMKSSAVGKQNLGKVVRDAKDRLHALPSN